MRKTLIITAIHGDENFSIPIVKDLRRKFNFDWLIANKKAKTRKVRYVEDDLNRVGPGKLKGSYEEEVAMKILNRSRKYKNVIDIHGTISNTGLFMILSDPNWENIELAKKIDIKNIVLWPSLKNKGPLTQFISNSLEIECGPKNSKEVQNELCIVLRKFLTNKKPKKPKKYFIVTGKYYGSSKDLLEFKRFYDVKNKNSFYPLMINQYKNKNITCYMMQKLSDTL